MIGDVPKAVIVDRTCHVGRKQTGIDLTEQRFPPHRAIEFRICHRISRSAEALYRDSGRQAGNTGCKRRHEGIDRA